MPDMSALTAEQNAALGDLGWALDEYRQAIERRINAETEERKARSKLYEIGREIAGVQ